MDQIKIGKFISKRRREKDITQSKLAELLGITDRAISKWENGNCMPDAATIPELCNILDITINDLFSGEVVDMKDNEKRLEDNLLEMKRLKEARDKELLNLEILIGFTVSIVFIGAIMIASYVEMESWLRILIIIVSSIIFIVGVCNAIKIEQTVGYYECNKCHHKYIPTYNSVFFAMHRGRSRYMKCPKCNKRSWNNKVITK